MNKRMTEQFLTMLNNLDALLVKATSHADAKKFDVNNFLTQRLAPDMLPFTKQVQIACDGAKFCAAYLSNQTAPAFEDNEKTMIELRERVKKTADYMKTALEFNFNDYKTVKVSPKWAKGKSIQGEDYLNQIAIPNFYFHIAMVYSLLRQGGVEVGKMDFLGPVNLKD